MQHAPDGLPITYFYTWPSMNTQAGFLQFRQMLLELKPSLVVIDTLAKVLNGKADQNSAGDMADIGNRFHDLALELGCMIIFIAHHGKMSTGDPGFDIRGSSAIPGATDVNIGLYKNEDGTFDMKGEGRDIEEFALRIKLDKEYTWTWQSIGEAGDIRKTESESKVMDALGILGESQAEQVANEMGITRQAANNILVRMRNEGKIHFRSDKGRVLYKLLATIATLSSSSKVSTVAGKGSKLDTSKKATSNQTQPATVASQASMVEDETTIVLPAGTPCTHCGDGFAWYADAGKIMCGKCQTPGG